MRDLIGKTYGLLYQESHRKRHPDHEAYTKPAIDLQTKSLERLQNRTI